MKKFFSYAAVFFVGSAYGVVVERLRNLNMINEEKAKSDKKYDDMMDRFLAE